jgi:hypothetical protein
MRRMLARKFIRAICNYRPNALLAVHDLLKGPLIINIDLLPNVNARHGLSLEDRVDKISFLR